MTDSTHAQVHFNEFGLPVATAFDDIYFTNEDGLAESHYVFLQHNGLPRRWQTHVHESFVIAESGFGTGLNFLAAWQLFLQHAPQDLTLHFISFEKYPLQRSDLARALEAFPQLAEQAAAFIEAYPAAEPGCHRRYFANGRIVLDLWLGDIHEQVPAWLPGATACVDAWFLDGFAPDKNPSMWQQSLFDAMARSGRADCSFATFTAAGFVRRGLQQAGFDVGKVKGFGRKREMLRGQLGSAVATTMAEASAGSRQTVTVVGAGIAAACTAFELQRAGFDVEVLSTGVADGASGNPQGAVYPLLHAERSPLAAFFTQAFGYATRFYAHQCPRNWFQTGVVQLAFNAAREQRYHKLSLPHSAGGPGYATATVQALTAEQTQQLWPALPPYPALHYPAGGWLRPAAVVEQLLSEITVREQSPLRSISRAAEAWQLAFADGTTRTSQRVVLACGAALTQLLAPFGVQLQNVRGQVTQVEATATSAKCPMVICYKGYFTPVDNGLHCVGATYDRGSEELNLRDTDQQENLANLCDNLAPAQWPQELEPVSDRAAIRNTTRDHLPMVGQLEPGLWVIGGLGSRGFTAAPLAANCLVAAMRGQPMPLAAELWQRLQPQRLVTG
ncbi:bifunctional tRNA (5-methylaminomethyl-2-thiouridine)(34)-methyltransferase MnmD/FAD-dependent 5-carboxymethylaminomethyl-2-thiouridine(34) oxidoreductase MnmC [Pseudidiomarina insulisalsae]|uniref:bifunctional tRNA (5-methylaminomethyl-2-thiouridine)(34)-methyltransferase MnmD/FAD-dependent 5-carboxymethylaminomethyl-2-thiouridine(34) oxidoreductase MnmC n=1 Tax=Pseudidiomarina insulisalsae TaxID=575789 RepID=UPI00130094AF|nr:bifunctional tRNA (5-methylaminomethyl-2-thiouridine)(34)-methyltransferase MnmD/FAD-dependent 5-carboxymethylaminomethyl-2-thiouridine(34) oxidoreductase MnmC [Pseudidiomarina insulisalsae]